MKKITELLKKVFKTNDDTAMYASEKIYADIVATAVDDERSVWVILCARDAQSDH